MVHTFVKKRNIPDMLEVIIQEAASAVQERRLSLIFAASRYGITHRYSTALQTSKNQQW
jgi:predicted metal-dependent hydrolase